MNKDGATGNLSLYTDALLSSVVTSSKSPVKRKARRKQIKPVHESAEHDAAELGDFVEYVAQEVFEALPEDLQTLSYAEVQGDKDLLERYSLPLTGSDLEVILERLPSNAVDSLVAFGVDVSHVQRFLEPSLSQYITDAVAVPPEHDPSNSKARPEGCEICERSQLPLTYHHLIPRSMHDRAVKRGWHEEWELAKVAWLCRACHSFVHRCATNEELAKSLHSVDLLLEREDIQRWANYARRLRWKGR